MFDSLSQKLERAFKDIKGQGRINELNIATTIKEIRIALLDADVNFQVAKQITDEIKIEAEGQKVLTAVSPGQMFIKIVNDKLIELMGGTPADFTLKGNPAIVLMCGLQGSGKTTFSAKLANMLKKQGKQVLMAACDIYRPAAIDQLKTLGEQIGVEVYSEPENKNAVQIAQNALKHAKQTGKSILIVDTAGRLAVDEEMMQEIYEVKQVLQPDETLFVVDAMTGQDAVNTAKAFNDRLNFDGVVLTKLDGDTRGGAALSIRRIVNKPIKFIGTGEKLDNLDRFYPERMAQRILGMGDVVTFVERAQQAFDEEEAKRLSKKFKKNQFDFNDLLTQIHQIKRMGDIKELMSMIPGLNKMVKDVNIDNSAFKSVEAIISSMTPKERENPHLMSESSRKKRVASGSGTSIQEVNNLVKQFEQMQKLMKKVNTMSNVASIPSSLGNSNKNVGVKVPKQKGGMLARILKKK
ncbi:MAG: signal recognition particle protein [Flammeovirgaceae bacterium]